VRGTKSKKGSEIGTNSKPFLNVLCISMKPIKKVPICFVSIVKSFVTIYETGKGF
jgi:hypothetical protein